MQKIRNFITTKCRPQEGLTVEELTKLIPEELVNKTRQEQCHIIHTLASYYHWICFIIQIMSAKFYLSEKSYLLMSLEWAFWIPLMVLMAIKHKNERMRIIALLKAELIILRLTVPLVFAETMRKKYETELEA